MTALELTEREVNPLIKYMLDQYNQAQADILAEMERIYGRFLSTVNPQDYYNIMIQYDRLNQLLQSVQSQYVYYSDLAGETIPQISSLGMTNAYYRQQYQLTWLAPQEMSFGIIDPRLVQLSVTGEQRLFKELAKKIEEAKIFLPQYGTLSSIIEKNQITELMKIQQTITQGFIQGWSIDDVTNEFMDIFDTTRFQAERIARTEFTRCANAGAYESTLEAVAEGVNIKRMWMASMDDKTREEHQELDGQIVEVDEPFTIGSYEAMFPGGFGDPAMDCSCRCTVVDLVNGEKLEGRAGINPVTKKREIFSYRSYNEYMADNGMVKDDNGKWVQG